MKRFLTLSIVIVMSLSLSVSAFASVLSNGWNGGEKLNFNPMKYHTVHSPSNSLKDLTKTYGLTWYENPQRFALKGEVMLVQLRTIQASLLRRGYKQLSANGENLLNFKDRDTLVSSAQEEMKILKAMRILSGDSNSYMNLDNYTTRAEVAKIVGITNESVLGIPETRGNHSFTDISSSWAKDHITHVYKAGLMDGINNLRFYPNNAITIEQVLEILNKQVGHYGITEEDVAKAMNETFMVTFDLDTSRITADKDSYSVKKNSFITVKVNVNPSTNKNLVFTSYDDSVSKVTSVNQTNKTAIVKGVKEGMTYVKVHIKDEPNVFTVIPIYVTSSDIAATGITANTSISLETGNWHYLTVSVMPSNATDKTVKYHSSNTNIAVVDSSGKVTGINKGTTVITSETHNGYKAYTTVSVTDRNSVVPATGISTTSNVSVEVGSGYYLDTTVLPHNATDKSVVYSSNDTTIARVTSNGRVIGVKKGVTVVTAQTHNGYKAYSIVTVTDKTVYVTGVTVTSNMTLEIGQGRYLATSVTPYNATDKSVIYYSNNENIAKVDSDGRIIGVSQGTAVITAQTHNGFKASCVVTVKSKTINVTGITVTNNMTLEIGDRKYVSAIVKPSNATDKSVIYYSNDNSVATVNSSGRVTAVGSGVAVITAQTHNGFTASCVVTVNSKDVPATSILFVDQLTMEVAERYYTTATVLPHNATDKSVRYTSSNTDIVSVNSSGRITAVNEGVAVITAQTHNGKQAHCVVTVKSKDSQNNNNSRSFMYADGYGESSYYNAFNDESITFIVSTNLSINSVTLDNNNCYISQNVSSHTEGWKFTVKTKTLSQNAETLVTVKLSNGENLTVRICIYP